MRIRGVAAELLLFLLFMWNTTEQLRMACLAFQSTSAILLYRLAVHFVHSKVSYSLLIYESFLGMTLLFAFWRSGASVWILGSGVLVGCYCFQHVLRGRNPKLPKRQTNHLTYLGVLGECPILRKPVVEMGSLCSVQHYCVGSGIFVNGYPGVGRGN